MKMQVFVQADYNDADYVSETSTIKESDLPRLRNIVAVIKKNKGYWNNQQDMGMDGPTISKKYDGQLSPEDLEWFDGFTPYGEYGIHTIETVQIISVVETLL
jgi:hypothetical protein